MQDMKKVIEAALFTAGKPMTVRELEKVCRVYNPILVQGKARELMKEFNLRNSSLEIIELKDSFKMKVKEPEEERVTHLAGANLFTKGELKTLAYIAYKQPVMQSSVVRARNTRAYDELKKLEQEKFIARERKGSSYVLTTTNRFNKYFGEEALQVLKKGDMDALEKLREEAKLQRELQEKAEAEMDSRQSGEEEMIPGEDSEDELGLQLAERPVIEPVVERVKVAEKTEGNPEEIKEEKEEKQLENQKKPGIIRRLLKFF